MSKMLEEVVVITGASAGVGRATAHAFASRGARLGLIARGADRLAATLSEVEARGGKGVAIPVDVADADGLDQAAEHIERTLGPIDIWVNGAMATVFGPFHSLTPEEFRRATEVTYLGFVHGTMSALSRMRPRNRGTIIQVGSALAYRSVPLQSAYCGAKAAIRGFTDSIRSELIHDRSDIHITMVQMPALNTPQFDWARNKLRHRPQPMPPIFQPEVAAEAIVFASSARRREIYVGGPTVQAILGNILAPGLLDRLLARKGYRGQLTDVLETPGRPDNLFAPVAVELQTHGRFDTRAKTYSAELAATERRPLLTVGLGLLALGGLALAARLPRREH